jgi:hypothetical protein
MSAIEITRQDLSISQLRAEAARTADAKQARWTLTRVHDDGDGIMCLKVRLTRGATVAAIFGT